MANVSAGAENYSTDSNATRAPNAPKDSLANYSLFFVALEIFRIAPYVFCGVATIGNSLSFAVMLRKKMRRNSSCVYFAALALADTLFVYMNTMSVAGSTLHVNVLTNLWSCRFIGFLQSFAGHASVLFIVTVTVERYIAIALPFKAQNLCTPKRAVVTIVCLTLFCVVLDLPVFWLATPEINEKISQCKRDVVNYPTLMVIYSWIDMSFYAFCPSMILCALNVLIIFHFRKSKKIQKRMTQKRDSTHFQLTLMLLTISAMFLICMVPLGIVYIAYSTGMFSPNPYDLSNYVTYVFVNQVLSVFVFMNHSCNFFLYCLSGERFRNELRSLLLCCKTSEVTLLTPKSSKYRCTSATDFSNVATSTNSKVFYLEQHPAGLTQINMEVVKY